jgi:serine protease Do
LSVGAPAGDIFNLPPGALGYLVKTVAAGSLGETVGLRGGSKVAAIDGDKIVVGGDIILSVQGIPVSNFASYEQIRRALIGLPAGASVTVTVLRAGQVLDCKAASRNHSDLSIWARPRPSFA